MLYHQTENVQHESEKLISPLSVYKLSEFMYTAKKRKYYYICELPNFTGQKIRKNLIIN